MIKSEAGVNYTTVNNNESNLKCKWSDCDKSYPNYIRLHVHLVGCHLKDISSPICLWDSCRTDMFQDYNQLLRHTLLHAFFENCVANTKKFLRCHHKIWKFICSGPSCQKPAYLQRSTSKFLWNPIILERGFECQWRNCDYVTSSAYLFVDHVLEHDYSDEDDEVCINDSSKLICAWQSSNNNEVDSSSQSICGYECKRRSRFHCHIRRHTGLPNFICSKCHACFTEFFSFKEHFIWSLVKDANNVIRFNESDDKDIYCSIEIKVISELSCFPKHLEGTILFQCPACIKTFITKEGWSTHRRDCSKSSNKNISIQRIKSSRLNESVSISRKRVFQPYFKTATTDDLFDKNCIYCCQVENCTYQSLKLSAYRAHYRRYHRSSNPDGLWYSCHLCTSFRARKSCTISHHLKSVHWFKPVNGRSTFQFTFDECSQSYQLTGRPPEPIQQRFRKLAPKKS
ncbi:unnamed protein product [Heterobilharzia americana]|nr:unnamed protein product [Heterobilharzia americana]